MIRIPLWKTEKSLNKDFRESFYPLLHLRWRETHILCDLHRIHKYIAPLFLGKRSEPVSLLLGSIRANVHRAVWIAVLVGTLLVLINHGDHIQEEPICSYFFLKTGLCYLVPFSVSIVSAILADLKSNRAC